MRQALIKRVIKHYQDNLEAINKAKKQKSDLELM